MLTTLSVRNLVLIEQATVAFSRGLTVLTGETGAGKSVLLGALDLVMGARGDASLVREGAKEAEIEATFDNVTLRRTLTAAGKSRAWVNDESVTLAELREAAAGLVDIHGPRANQEALLEDFPRETLDAHGAVKTDDVKAAYAAWCALRAEAERLNRTPAGSLDEEADFLRFQISEIEQAALEDDDETIGARHAAAAHAAEILEGATTLTEVLAGDDSAASRLIGLQPLLHDLKRHLPAATEWSTEIEDLTGRLQELSRTVAETVGRLDVGPDDLAALDARLGVVSRLTRKYGGSVAAVRAQLAEKKSRLDELENREAKRAELARQIAAAERELRAQAAKVTAARQAVAPRLAKALTRELHDLGFLQAKFTVTLTPTEPTASGCDRVDFLFEPNPGEPARPLAAIASSGEIARVMLAVKVLTRVSRPTLVFDEIDANLGGEVARTVGEKLASVARHHQVIAITHLPQTAVFGQSHFIVSKRVVGGRTLTDITPAEGETRVREIARMLGGESVTSVVKEHAEELLKLSR